MRLVLPTARSPTTLIFSLRRRSRKDSATPLPGSKALRDDYQPVNSAKRRLGRDRTGGNPSSALRGIGCWTMDSGGGAMYSAWAPAASAPSTFGGPLGFAVFAFTLSVLSGLVALALRLVGQKRRAQFFEQLGVA